MYTRWELLLKLVLLLQQQIFKRAWNAKKIFSTVILKTVPQNIKPDIQCTQLSEGSLSMLFFTFIYNALYTAKALERERERLCFH